MQSATERSSEWSAESNCNGEGWVYANGQLKAIVNGQLKSLVNNFDVSGTNNNSKAVVLIDEDDINLQYGDARGYGLCEHDYGLVGEVMLKLVPGAFGK